METTGQRPSLELALKVLKRGTRLVYHEELEERRQAIKELEAMIEHQEPVAYVTGFHNGHCVIQPTDPALVLPVGMALYRSPKEWVGLTDEEVYQAESGCWFLDELDKTLFARAIEAKLREKNHG
jgi:hypothetical protein